MAHDNWMLFLYALVCLVAVLGLSATFGVWLFKFMDRRRKAMSKLVTEDDVKEMHKNWCSSCTFVGKVLKEVNDMKEEFRKLRDEFHNLHSIVTQEDINRSKERVGDQAEHMREKAIDVSEKKDLAVLVEDSRQERDRELSAVSVMIGKIADSVAMMAFDVKNKKKKEAILNEMIALQRRMK